MKFLVRLSFLLVSILTFNAQALEVPADCYKPSHKLLFNEVTAADKVISGEVTQSVRVGFRCFAAGDELAVIFTKAEDRAKGRKGFVAITETSYISFAGLTDNLVKGTGQSAEQLRAQLVEIYGEEVKDKPLTVLSFKKVATAPETCYKSSHVMLYAGETAIADVKSGKITATVRTGLRCFSAGDKLALINSDDKENGRRGWVTVTSAAPVKFAEINAEVAQGTGKNAEDLKAQLIELYGEEVQDRTLSVIRFQN